MNIFKSDKKVKRPVVKLSVFIFLIIFVFAIIISIVEFEIELFKAIDSIKNSITTTKQEIEIENVIDTSINDLISYFNSTQSKITSDYINGHGHSRKELNNVSSMSFDDDIYFIDNDGRIFTSTGAPKYDFSSLDLDSVEDEKMFFDETSLIYVIRLQDGLLIDRATEASDVSLEIDKNSVSRQNTIIVNKDGVITDAFDEKLLDTQLPALNMDTIRTDGKIDSHLITVGNEIYNIYIAEKIGDYYLVSYYSIIDILSATVRRGIFPLSIFVLVSVLALLLFGRLLKETDEEIAKNGNTKANTYGMLSELAGILIFGALLIIFISIYSKNLIEYSNSNLKAINTLESLKTNINIQETDMEYLKEVYIEGYVDIANTIAKSLEFSPDYLTEYKLNSIKDLAQLSAIDVYDYDGMLACSTHTTASYKLSTEPDSREYIGWSVLNGTEEYVIDDITNISEEKCLYVRRQDKAGLIRITIPSNLFDSLVDSYNIETYLHETYFNNASKMYIDKTAPDMLHIMAPNGTSYIISSEDLPEKALSDGYAGIHTIDGIKYYINTSNLDDYIIICATDIRDINSGSLSVILTLLLGFAIVYLIMVIIIIRTYGLKSIISSYKSLSDSNSIKQKISDGRYKKTLVNIVIITSFVIILCLAIDYMISKTPIITYIFSNNWGRGINIFSFTTILIMAISTAIISNLLVKSIDIVGANLGPRGVTFSHLFSTLIKISTVLGIIIYALLQCGMNPGTLFASVGITGAVIGIGAQPTINDILSGFFIVFEGNFHIGDWVEVGDFKGVITKIGVRTTQIDCWGNVKSVNNSSMKDVVNLSIYPSYRIIEVKLEHSVDLRYVENLVHSSSQFFYERMPQLTRDPDFVQVTNIDENGVTVGIRFYCNENDIDQLERTSQRAVHDLLFYNNVAIVKSSIGYPEITVVNKAQN